MSECNESEGARRVVILAYNKADNSALSQESAGHHPMYTPIHRVPNTDILNCENISDFSGKDFLDPANDKTTRGQK